MGISNRSFRILETEVGLISDWPDILGDDEYFTGQGRHLHSLLSNFHTLEEIPFSSAHTAYVLLTSCGDLPFSSFISDDRMQISGPLEMLEQETLDKRSSIFGNMGIFSKFLIKVLEKQGIFSFHSTSFYDRENGRLFLVLGGSGSGKSTVLLKAIEQGLEVFGTEIMHAGFKDGDLIVYKGPVIQNCRVGNLVEDFPVLIERFSLKDVPSENVWHSYLSVDFSGLATPEDMFINPDITCIFPRIEADRIEPEIFPLSKDGLEMRIFENLCEKISPPSHVYNREFVPSIDTREDILNRWHFSRELARYGGVRELWKSLASPHQCLQHIVKERRRSI